MKKQLFLAFFLVSTALSESNLLPAFAQTQKLSVPSPETAPLNYRLLDPKAKITGLNIVTSNTVSPSGLSRPSLWWAQELFAGKLLSDWIAYPDEYRVDLVVNRQLWSLLDSFGRYSFVNKFGTIARQYHYATRVFVQNQWDKPVATYTCSFSTALATCNIKFELTNQGTLRDIAPQ